jgi:hypothetical protein
MSTNLGKPLRLRNDGGAQLQLERSGTTRSLTVNTSGNVELDGTLIPTALTTASATITGGSINGTTIGATTASTGAFTTLSATGTVTGGKFAPTANTTAGNGMYLPTTNTLAFSTNGLERLRLTSGTEMSLSADGSIAALVGTHGLNIGDTAKGSAFVAFETAQRKYGIGTAPSLNDALVVFDSTTTTVERMRIDSAGNLGLGVTPSAWASSAAAYSVMQIRNAAFYGISTNIARMSANAFVDAGGANNYISNGFATRHDQVDGEFRWLTAPSGTAGNAITFTQAMTLDASGRLGIGKTAPLTKLHIADTAEMLFDCSASSSHIAIYRDATPTHAAAIGYNTPGQSLTNDLVFSTFVSPSWGERMRITSAGNVGIGTTAPGAALDVGSIQFNPSTAVEKKSIRIQSNIIGPVNDNTAVTVFNITKGLHQSSSSFSGFAGSIHIVGFVRSGSSTNVCSYTYSADIHVNQFVDQLMTLDIVNAQLTAKNRTPANLAVSSVTVSLSTSVETSGQIQVTVDYTGSLAGSTDNTRLVAEINGVAHAGIASEMISITRP